MTTSLTHTEMDARAVPREGATVAEGWRTPSYRGGLASDAVIRRGLVSDAVVRTSEPLHLAPKLNSVRYQRLMNRFSIDRIFCIMPHDV